MKTRIQVLLAVLIVVKIVLGSIFMYRAGVSPLFGNSDAFAAEQKKDAENTALKNVNNEAKAEETIDLKFIIQQKSEFEVKKGPIFSNMILADEVNRATPKTQSALLEAMQEHTVTVANETYRLPEPFFVIATQNPAYQVGTFPLPESQLDRFLMRVQMGYPEGAAERALLAGEDCPVELAGDSCLGGHQHRAARAAPVRGQDPDGPGRPLRLRLCHLHPAHSCGESGH